MGKTDLPASKAVPVVKSLEPSPESAVPTFSENGRFVVQVACAASGNEAEAIASRFKQKGFPVYVVEVRGISLDMDGLYYRVRIGGFDGYSEAAAFGKKFIRPEGYDFWVDRKSNDAIAFPARQTAIAPLTPPVQMNAEPLITKSPAKSDSTASPGFMIRSPLDLLLKGSDTNQQSSSPASKQDSSAISPFQPTSMPVESADTGGSGAKK